MANGPDWAAQVGAIAGGVSALVVVVGAVAAARYLIRGTTSVEAEASTVGGGHVVIHVRTTIASQGASAIRLEHSTENSPIVQVFAYTREGPAKEGASREVFPKDVIVGPGETISDSAVFIVDRPGPDVLGWEVWFTVGAPRWLRPDWSWLSRTFVPAPPTRVLTRA